METFSQFKLHHAFVAVTSFSIAAAVYPREPWLGIVLLLLTTGCLVRCVAFDAQ